MKVSELNLKAKVLLEAHFMDIELNGEISKITLHSSGHWYFDLKDERASIACAMFKGANNKVDFRPEVGVNVDLTGFLSLYETSGRYQFIAKTMQKSGFGDLEAKFLALKQKLEAEGLFNEALKKSLPAYPKKVGIITSLTSAALQDMLKLIEHKGYFLAKFFIFNALTQGNNAPTSLMNALKKADKMGLDVIIIARGGGSREDLFCFNDESLARAIFNAQTPIISAIGHEIDYVISDFVADFRAPTPSAAINFLLKDKFELMQSLDELEEKFKNALKLRFNSFANKLQTSLKMLKLKAPQSLMNTKIIQLENLKKNLKTNFNFKVQKASLSLENLSNAFFQHKAFFEKSKDLVQIYKNGHKMSLENLQKDDIISLHSALCQKSAQIL